MSIEFFPFNIPVSTSRAISASLALTTDTIPVTASFAEFAVNNVGPTGPPAITVNAIII